MRILLALCLFGMPYSVWTLYDGFHSGLMALQLRGIPTALVKVPGASHGGIAARPSQSAAKASAILAWFERYRQKPGDVAATEPLPQSGN